MGKYEVRKLGRLEVMKLGNWEDKKIGSWEDGREMSNDKLQMSNQIQIPNDKCLETKRTR